MTDNARQSYLTSIEEVYGRKLRRFLAARMRNAAADVQDLTQEVYLRLLRVEDHEVIRNPQAYLFTIASHVLHQHLLRQAATPHAMEYTDVATAIQAVEETDPATLAEVEQRFDNVARALEKASPRAYATKSYLNRRTLDHLRPLAAIATRS